MFNALIPLVALVLTVASLHAQSPKWSFQATAPQEYDDTFLKHLVFDGFGATALNVQFDGPGQERISTLAWLDVQGRVVYSNTFAGDTTLRLLRFTKTELATHVRSDGSTQTNYILRLRKTGSRVVASSLPVPAGETPAGGQVGAGADVKLLRTTQVNPNSLILRAYTNP